MRKTILFIAICLVTACNSKKSEPFTINLESYKGETDLKLSDLLTDIRIIPLETTDESIIRGHGAAISDDYIVIADFDRINLYDKNGKYIRRLASQGNGPEEFNSLYSIFLDENNILYFTIEEGKINRIDIENNRYLDPITPAIYPISIYVADKDQNLYMTGSGSMSSFDPIWKDSTFLFSVFDKKNMQESIVKSSFPIDNRSSGLGALYSYDNKVYYFNRNYSDTLYIYQNHSLNPHIRVEIADEMKKDAEEGNTVSLVQYSHAGIIFSHNKNKTRVELLSNNRGRTTYRESELINYLIYNNKSGLKRVASMRYDPLGIEISARDYIVQMKERNTRIQFFPQIIGNYAYYKLEAFKMIELLELAIEEGELNSSEKDNLRAILNSIKEDDNPCLIIGKIR